MVDRGDKWRPRPFPLQLCGDYMTFIYVWRPFVRGFPRLSTPWTTSLESPIKTVCTCSVLLRSLSFASCVLLVAFPAPWVYTVVMFS